MRNLVSFAFLTFILLACSQEPPATSSSKPAIEPSPSASKLEPYEANVHQFDMSDFEDNVTDSEGTDNLLPDLFADHPQEKKTTFSGTLLRDEENPDLMQSVEGAEISIKVKTGK